MSSGNGVFAYLVKHDFRLEFQRQAARKWVYVYLLILAALALIALAVWGDEKGFNPKYLLFSCYAFPFFIFSVSFRMLKREWSNGTYGWWLSLPYSRFKLLAAKWVASLAQTLVLVVIFSGGLLLLELFQIAMHGGAGTLADFLAAEGQFLLVVIGVAPIMLSFGLFAYSIAKTKFGILMPLIWIVFGLSGNAFTWVIAFNPDASDSSTVELFHGNIAPWFWLLIPAVWIVAALLFGAAVKVCKKHLQL